MSDGERNVCVYVNKKAACTARGKLVLFLFLETSSTFIHRCLHLKKWGFLRWWLRNVHLSTTSIGSKSQRMRVENKMSRHRHHHCDRLCIAEEAVATIGAPSMWLCVSHKEFAPASRSWWRLGVLIHPKTWTHPWDIPRVVDECGFCMGLRVGAMEFVMRPIGLSFVTASLNQFYAG